MSLTIHFNETDWERIDRDWTAWWAGGLRRPMVIIEGWVPAPNLPSPPNRHFASNFSMDTPAETIIDFYQAQLACRRYYGDAWPKWWPNFGPGIGAGFLGARVQSERDTVWFEPAGPVQIEALSLAYQAANVWWQRIQELTQAAVAHWGNRICVGFTDIGGNLDILASLYTTQQLLFELYDAPDEVARLVSQITKLWLRFYDELHQIIHPTGRGTTPWAPIWSPGRCYMLQSDFAYMISPDMFERFVMPDLAACCQVLDHAFYHLDGIGQIRHLDQLLALERLRGIQWIPGAGQPEPEGWLPLLKRIRDRGKLCQLYVSPAGARTIVRELGGRGFAFFIDVKMTSAEADAFLRLLAADDANGCVPDFPAPHSLLGRCR